MSQFRQASIFACVSLLTATGLVGCQRGEKTCRYYSIVLERAESAAEKRSAVESIKKLNVKDQQTCDDKVFERLNKSMADKAYRPLIIDAVENVGRGGPKLRERSEKLLASGLGIPEAAGQIAGIIRTWRAESLETREPWVPMKETTEKLAAAIKKSNGPSRVTLVEALFTSLPDPKDRAKYEDLLIELADTDPSLQTVEVNIRALQFLTEMRSVNVRRLKLTFTGFLPTMRRGLKRLCQRAWRLRPCRATKLLRKCWVFSTAPMLNSTCGRKRRHGRLGIPGRPQVDAGFRRRARQDDFRAAGRHAEQSRQSGRQRHSADLQADYAKKPAVGRVCHQSRAVVGVGDCGHGCRCQGFCRADCRDFKEFRSWPGAAHFAAHRFSCVRCAQLVERNRQSLQSCTQKRKTGILQRARLRA